MDKKATDKRKALEADYLIGEMEGIAANLLNNADDLTDPDTIQEYADEEEDFGYIREDIVDFITNWNALVECLNSMKLFSSITDEELEDFWNEKHPAKTDK